MILAGSHRRNCARRPWRKSKFSAWERCRTLAVLRRGNQRHLMMALVRYWRRRWRRPGAPSSRRRKKRCAATDWRFRPRPSLDFCQQVWRNRPLLGWAPNRRCWWCPGSLSRRQDCANWQPRARNHDSPCEACHLLARHDRCRRRKGQTPKSPPWKLFGDRGQDCQDVQTWPLPGRHPSSKRP